MTQKSYHLALINSQANLYAALGSLAVASLAAIPLGLVGAAIPLIAFGVGEALALLFVPDMSSFRTKVDREERKAQRAKVRTHLINEIRRRVPITIVNQQLGRQSGATITGDNARRINDYNKMIARIQSLSDVAADHRTQLGSSEIERLHEACVDYLSLWLASLIMDSREQSVNENHIKLKLADIQNQLRTATANNARGLRQAQNDYQAMLASRSAMQGKIHAIEAAMLSMPDKIEEIYQMVLASSFSPTLGGKLEDSLSRLRLEEELEHELSVDLSPSMPAALEALRTTQQAPRDKSKAAQKTAS